MSKLFLKLDVYRRLGLTSIARVAGYRVGLKTGLNPVKRISAEPVQGPFFKAPDEWRDDMDPSKRWEDSALYFGWNEVPLSGIPHWHQNPFSGEHARQNIPWWELGDFDSAVGDIKTVWEASRFDWVLCLAQRAALGNTDALSQLNLWLDDWSRKNPPFMGANWKCGQEASIRVMHLAMASILLKQTACPSTALIDLIRVHLRRIAPTIRYAVGQDNNHGTSEAAALFIGGTWLLVAEDGGRKTEVGGPRWKEARRWRDAGRKWMENRVARLIEDDGSFSQYSVNYHRVMLDTLSMVEVWRRHLSLPVFSERFIGKAASASKWLFAMTQRENGDAPNLGANDGARLLPLTDTDDRDFRPAVQLAMALFTGQRAYAAEGDWNLPLKWLGVDLPEKPAESPQSQQFDQGGYAVMRSHQSMGLIRYPRFRFRPSHADALHFDLWYKGINILRDGGTFSYNTDPEKMDYFSGTSSHNTIQFDGRNQMPRLGRFLFGAWLTTEVSGRKTVDGGRKTVDGGRKTVDGGRRAEVGGQWSGGYTDYRKNRHHRTVQVVNDRWRISDEVSGPFSSAVLRWRLAPGEWKLKKNTCVGEYAKLTISENIPAGSIKLTEGWESRYYMKKTPLPVLEIIIPEGTNTVTTEIYLD